MKSIKYNKLNNMLFFREYTLQLDGFSDGSYQNEDSPGIPLSSIQNQVVYFGPNITPRQAVELLTNGGCGD